MYNKINKNLHPSQLFQFSLIIFITGITIASFWEIDWRRYELWLFAAVLGFLLAAVFWRRQKAIFRITGLIGLFLFLALWRYSLTIPLIGPDHIAYYNGQSAQVSGMITAVDRRLDKQILKVAVRQIVVMKSPWAEDGTGAKQAVGGNLQVYAQKYPEYRVGDRITVKTDLEPVEPLDDFRYDRFLAKDRIYSLAFYPQIKFEHHAGPKGLSMYTERVRQGLARRLDRNLQSDEAAVARAMLLGDKSRLRPAVKEAFAHSGLAHITAISGLHISLLVIILMQILIILGMWRRQAVYVITVLLLAYLFLIGWPASAVRAALMAWLVLLAYHLRRLGDSGKLLLLAAGLTLLINPRLLRDDVGWQLSFLAVAAIIYIFPLLEALVEKKTGLKDKWKLRSIVLITVSVQIATLPILAHSFGSVSLYSPLANLLVLPLLPVVMVCLIAALALSWLPGPLSLILFGPAQIGLAYFKQVAVMINNLPFTVLSPPPVAVIYIILYYFILAGFVIYSRKKTTH